MLTGIEHESKINESGDSKIINYKTGSVYSMNIDVGGNVSDIFDFVLAGMRNITITAMMTAIHAMAMNVYENMVVRDGTYLYHSATIGI